MSTPSIATITVMRGEVERMPALFETTSWSGERHLVETAPELVLRELPADVRVHHHPLARGASFDSARNAAIPHVAAEWVFIIDTDELMPPTLVRRLEEIVRDSRYRHTQGVWVPRVNHVLGRPLRYSSVWPDYQLRLLRRSAARFGDRLHSFSPNVQRTERLPAEPALALQHYSFESTQAFLDKLNLYSSIEAGQQAVGGGVYWAAIRAARDLVGRYVRRGGFLDGPYGLHLSIMMAINRYLVEVKRWEKRGRT